jgi:putative ABC transport system permease protein
VTARHRESRRHGAARPGALGPGALGPGALGLDLRTLPRRARAQAGPLLLVVLLLALVTALASAGPRAVARVADDAVADALARTGAAADVVVTAAVGYEQTGQAADPEAAAHAVAAADALGTGLRDRLGDVLAPPVTLVTSGPLDLRATSVPGAAPTTPTTGETTVRLAWLHGEDTGVTWTAGRAPAGDPGSAARPATVQVGLASEVADGLGAGVGSTLSTQASGGDVELLVTGVFEAAHPPAWAVLDEALVPRITATGPATTTQVAAVLSDASLPDLLEAVDPRQVTRTVRLSPAPGLGADAARVVLDALPAVRASPAVLGPAASGASVHTGLGSALGGALDDVARARAQTGALVGGVVAVGVLLLLLTAGLLALRRTGELAARRTRGARLTALGLEQGIEALVVVVLGGGAGLVAAALLLPGPRPGPLVLPAALVTLVALPVAALLTAGRAADPRGTVHAGPTDAAGRRTAAEVALAVLAVAAVVTLHRGAGGGPDALGAAAPAALAAVGAAVVARVLPVVLRRLAPLVERSRRAVPVLAVARARSDGLAALPLLALGTAAALVVVSVSAALAVDRDRVAASWDEVGGDVRVTGPATDLAALAGTWAGAPGVDLVVTAERLDGPRVRTADGRTDARVLVGDPAAFRSLAAAAGRAAPGPAGEVELQVDGTTRTVAATSLAFAGAAAPDARGDAPVLLVPAADVDTGTLPEDRAAGVAWLVGPGSAAAVAGAAASDGSALVVTGRAAVLADLRAEVLPRARTAAGWASAGLLTVLVALTVLVGAARGGPARRRALDTLRTVGLGDAEAWRVAAAELAPGALVATVAGTVTGYGVSAVVLGPLVGGGGGGVRWADVAWAAGAVPVLAAVLTAAGVVLTEQGRGGTHRLGEVLRAAG